MHDLIKARATLDESGAVVGYSRLEDNPITDTDSYKASHYLQYPDDMQSMYCYFEPRGGRYRYALLTGLQVADGTGKRQNANPVAATRFVHRRGEFGSAGQILRRNAGRGVH